MILLALQLAVADCRSPISDCRLRVVESAISDQQSAIASVQSAIGNQQSAILADSFPILTLGDALARSLRLNPDYVRALGSVAEADWSRMAARLAFLAPTVNVGIDYSKYSQAFFNIGTERPASTSATFRLDASYDVFSVRKFTELGRTAAELDRATATEAQQRFAAALLTESAYYAVLADQELARVAAGRAARAEEQLVLSRARVASGAAVQTDSLSVRLELTRAQVELLRQQSQLRVSRLELGRRAGLDGPAGAAELDSAPPPPLPIGLGEAVAQALEQGPAYRMARARERAADAALRGRRGAYLPTVTLSAAHSRFDVRLFPNASNVSSLTLSAFLPLWNHGDRELDIRRAATERNVARVTRADLERAALREVTEAYDGYETSRAEVGLVGDGVIVARENYRVQEARYRAGATTVLDLLAAQNALSLAEATLVQSRYSARLALARLEAILGTRLGLTQGGGQ